MGKFVRAQVAAILKNGKWNMIFLPGHAGRPEQDILEKIARDMTEKNEIAAICLNIYQWTADDQPADRKPVSYLDCGRKRFATGPPMILPALGNQKPCRPLRKGKKRWRRSSRRPWPKYVKRSLIRRFMAGNIFLSATMTRALFPRRPDDNGAGGKKHDNYYFLARQSFYSGFRSRHLYTAPVSRHEIRRPCQRTIYRARTGAGNHRHYFFDSYDIASLLRKGLNWLAVEVHSPVRATYAAAPVMPALIAEIEGLLATDGTWQVVEDPSHNMDGADLYAADRFFGNGKI